MEDAIPKPSLMPEIPALLAALEAGSRGRGFINLAWAPPGRSKTCLSLDLALAIASVPTPTVEQRAR